MTEHSADAPRAARSDDFDPLAPETFDSPYPVYERLRAECPVAWTSAFGGFWALARHADVARTATDYRTFVNSVQNVVPKVAFTGRRPPLHLDPPEHTPYRAALNPLLSERRVAALEPAIRRICGELLEPMIARGQGDLCEDFSSHLPVHVFAEWMRIPPDMAEPLRQAGRAFNVAVQSNIEEVVKETSLALYAMARDLIALRRAEPMDPEVDPTSALLAARHEGQPLPDDLIIGCVRQVLVVGIIAPTVVIGSIGVHLSRHPDLQHKLRAEPALIAPAVEEFLRLYTPYRGFARTANRDVEICGRTIARDEPIALLYASANRDESVFERADEFILDRPNLGDSLAFGRGPHNCPGAALGRLQLRIALEELLARTASFEVCGPIRPTRMPEIGALSVPVTLVRA
ncbi:cytochrome P450 [Phenylobacterium soli]|uniref:Cytochrome P450 n=1 Tax=Phenylobacterium soli TaxID=2170551 RepID=A0A328AAZ8_9CAUL|nr:cytochrome P450 [Phenylobacterium soli]RAK51790.1 cytochrome P450 [Phenylobacterium soli]